MLIVADDTGRQSADLFAQKLRELGYLARVITLAELRPSNGVTSVLVGFATERESRHLHALESRCGREQLGWVRSVVAPALDLLEVGPFFQPADAGKLRDFERDTMPSVAQSKVSAGGSVVSTGFCMALAARWLDELTRREDPYSATREFVRADMVHFCSTRRNAVLLSGEDAASPAATYLRFEAGIARRSASADPEVRSTPVRLPKERGQTQLTYPNSRVRSCVAPAPLSDREVANAVPDRTAIATLLLYGVGYRVQDVARKQYPSRFAPSAGNLGSPTAAYLIPEREGADCPNLLVYRPDSHEEVLYKPRGLRSRWKRLLRNVDEPSAVQAVVLLFAQMPQLFSKYGSFAYHLALLDAGVAMCQMKLAAREMGRELIMEFRANRLVASELLNLREGEQHLTLIATMRRTAPTGALGRTSRRPTGDEIPTSLYPAEVPREIMSAALRVKSHRMFAAQPCASTDESAATRLPLADVLQRRRSSRSEWGRMPSLDAMEHLLRTALGVYCADWESGQAEEFGVRPYVLWGEVRLRYDSREGRLVVLEERMKLDRLIMYADACFEPAPVAIWITGDLSQLRSGRDYEELLIRVGALANLLNLFAWARQMEATIVGGVVPRAGQQAFGLKGWQEWPLCAVVLGGGTSDSMVD